MTSFNIPVYNATEDQILSIVGMLQSAGYSVGEPRILFGLHADYAACSPSARTLFQILVGDGSNRWSFATIHRLHVQKVPSDHVTTALTEACLTDLMENRCVTRRVSDPDTGNILTGGSVLYEFI